MALKRSNIEFSKRVFLDRLTTDAQGLSQPGNIDVGPGDWYVRAGYYDAFNLGVGADCSGAAGIFIGAAMLGPADMSWTRQFTTETFPNPFAGFRQVSQADLVNGNYPIKVCIMNGGGGDNSHMNICIDGWLMESNTHGTCTLNHGAIPQDSTYWNHFWVLDGPIKEDTTWRQPMSYPRGLDYSGRHIAGASLKKAGVAFVCRYITDGAPKLPNKLMTRAEADDLRTNGIEIVSNWENYETRMSEGYAAGRADALAANAKHLELGGPPNAPIYFSCDYDEPESAQNAVNEYLRACGDVLGGPQPPSA